jgi:RNAse (barnase) inhibitor barstar
MISVVTVDCARISDWDTFHIVFSEAFGFPDYYGRNLNAWIDCLTRLDEELTDLRVSPGDFVLLQLSNADTLKNSAPEILTALLEMAGFVNFRRTQSGQPAILLISCNC